MNEVTRIYTVEITKIDRREEHRPLTEDEKREVADNLKALIRADDVVVTNVQDFVRDC